MEQTFEQKIAETLNFVREEAKSSSPRIENLEKAHAALDAQEKKNQELIREIAEKANKAAELESRLNSLEADLKRGIGGEAKEGKAQELKAFEKMLRAGSNFRFEPEAKFLRSDVDISGGYLAPSQFMQELLKNITEISPIRSIARVSQTANKEVEFPKMVDEVAAFWTGQGQTLTGSDATFGVEKVVVHKLSTYVDITLEMIQDSGIDIITEVKNSIVRNFAKAEGAAFVSGNQTISPEGFLSNGNISSINSGSASAITGDSLLSVQGELKAGYNPYFVLNRKTLHQHIRTLKASGSGEYLFQMGINGAIPNTIAGVPYIIANDMPDVAANAYPVAFGDFFQGYRIVDNVNLILIEDQFSKVLEGKRRYVAHRRVGGKVILPEAIKKIKIAS